MKTLVLLNELELTFLAGIFFALIICGFVLISIKDKK